MLCLPALPACLRLDSNPFCLCRCVQGLKTAMTSKSVAEGCKREFDHLPDCSEELAAAANLLITLDGCQLPLHSQVLAAGSRVLRQALAGAASGGGAPSQQAAVQEAFSGLPLAHVMLFLKLLYSGYGAAEQARDTAALTGAVALADKLDAPSVLQVDGGLGCLGLLACLSCARWPGGAVQACILCG